MEDFDIFRDNPFLVLTYTIKFTLGFSIAISHLMSIRDDLFEMCNSHSAFLYLCSPSSQPKLVQTQVLKTRNYESPRRKSLRT